MSTSSWACCAWGWLSRRTKALATLGIVASLTVSATLLIDGTPLRIVLGLVGVYAVWFVWSRPDAEMASRSRSAAPLSPTSEQRLVE